MDRRRRDRRRVRSHANINMRKRVELGHAGSAEIVKIVNANVERAKVAKPAMFKPPKKVAVVAYRFNIRIDPNDYSKEQADYGDLVVVIYENGTRKTVMRRYSTNRMDRKALKVNRVVWTVEQ